EYSAATVVCLFQRRTSFGISEGGRHCFGKNRRCHDRTATRSHGRAAEGPTQAHGEGLDITPRDGAEAARRSYADTVRLWNSRFLPALDHWTKAGRLKIGDADRLRALPVHEQVPEVLELERDGIFFSKDLSKSVLYSIAAPSTSQHIAMLAFDANEFLDPRV